MRPTDTTRKALPCPYCKLADRTQHSVKRSGQCDGIRKGKLYIVQDRPSLVTEPTGN